MGDKYRKRILCKKNVTGFKNLSHRKFVLCGILEYKIVCHYKLKPKIQFFNLNVSPHSTNLLLAVRCFVVRCRPLNKNLLLREKLSSHEFVFCFAISLKKYFVCMEKLSVRGYIFCFGSL